MSSSPGVYHVNENEGTMDMIRNVVFLPPLFIHEILCFFGDQPACLI